jgi:osmoprotectant transport system substrate-binding protein
LFPTGKGETVQVKLRHKAFMAAVAGMTLLISACGGGGGSTSGSGGNGGPISIATKNFTENRIMGVFTKLLLEKKGHGFTVTLKEISGNASVRDGLTGGQYDGYWEYLGTGLIDVFKQTETIADPVAAVAKLNQLDAPNKITWLPAVQNFNDPDVLLVKDTAKYGTTFSQLATYLAANPRTKVCLQAEFLTRGAGLPAIQAKYTLPAASSLNIQTLNESLAVQSLSQGGSNDCQVAQGFGTDARIKANGLTVLKDDKGALPNDSFSLSIKKETLDKYPSIKDILDPLLKNFSTDDSIAVQKKVDVDKQNIEVVATEYLKSKGLI